MRILGQIALPEEPVLHGVLELIQGYVGTDLHLTVCERKRVVENRGVREVPQGKDSEPLERAGKFPVVDFVFYADLAGEHRFDLITRNRAVANRHLANPLLTQPVIRLTLLSCTLPFWHAARSGRRTIGRRPSLHLKRRRILGIL